MVEVVVGRRSYLHSLITWWMSNSKAANKMLSRGSGLLSPPRNMSRLDCGKATAHSISRMEAKTQGTAGLFYREPLRGVRYSFKKD